MPQALAEKVRRYTSFRSAVLADWHPTKRELLITTRFGDTVQVHHVQQPLGARFQLTFEANAVYSQIRWVAPDAFISGRDVGGDEQYQLVRQDLAGNVTLLTDGKSRNTEAVVSRSGKLVAYGSTRRSGKDVDVWVSSTSDGSGARMLGELSGGGWTPLAFSPDEKQLVVGNFVSVADARLFVVDVASGKQAPLSPAAPRVEAWGPRVRFSPDGKFVYGTCDAGSEFLQLVKVELATGKRTVLTAHLPYDVELFDLASDGKRAVLVTNEKGRSAVRVLDVATGKEKPLANQPPGVVYDASLHANGRDLGLSVSSNRGGTDVYSVDLGSGKVERWTKSETGGFDTSGWSEAELIEWKSFDGKLISGFVNRPPKRFTGKRPVIISIHGGPEWQTRPDALGKWNYVTEELGVAFIAPNVRGSTGFGKTFAALDDGFGREGAYQDIAALLDWVKAQPDLDAERVLVAGGSYGGFMTLAVAANYAERIRCAIDVVGPSNFVTFLENTSGYRKDLRRVEYGDERDPKMREFLERIAPAKKAAAITKPLFVVQGLNDPRVPASEAEQMVATVRQGKGKAPVWYLLAKDEGHGFQKQKNVEYLFWAELLFMQKFLLE